MLLSAIALAVLLQPRTGGTLKPWGIGKGFTILFPSRPHLADPSEKPPSDSWTVDFQGASFIAGVEPRPVVPLPDQLLVHNVAATFGKSLEVKVTLGNDFVQDGWIGVPFTFKSKELKIEGRACIVDKWLVTMAVVGPNTLPIKATQSFLTSLNPPANLKGRHTLEELAASNKPSLVDIGNGLRVTFPVAPSAMVPPAEPTVKYWVAVKDGVAFVAGASDDPVTDTNSDDRALTAAKYGQAAGARGSITHQVEILVNGWPGMEIDGAGDVGRFRCRCYRIHRQFVNLLVRYQGSVLPAIAKPFLESLQLPPSIPAGPYKSPGPEFKTYEYKEAGLSVDFPNPPERTTNTLVNGDFSAPQVRYESTYGDRDYGFLYCELPPEASAKMDSLQLDTLLDKVVKNTLRDMKLKETRRSVSVTQGIKTLSVEGANDGFSGRVDVFYRHRKCYIFIAEVPKALFPSDEVTRFFESIKWLDPKK